jgi:hypothetical protein
MAESEFEAAQADADMARAEVKTTKVCLFVCKHMYVCMYVRIFG